MTGCDITEAIYLQFMYFIFKIKNMKITFMKVLMRFGIAF